MLQGSKHSQWRQIPSKGIYMQIAHLPQVLGEFATLVTYVGS